MQARVKWTDGRQFLAESGTGHSVVMDGSPESGGRNTGPRPMEMILLGLGGCASYDIVQILEKARADISDCTVDIKAERADSTPSVFTKIHLHFTVIGRGLKESQVERAVSLSAEKYCSVSFMLRDGGVEITHSFEVIKYYKVSSQD